MADLTTNEDFLDAPVPSVSSHVDSFADAPPMSAPRRGVGTWMSTGAWLVAGLVIGALAVALLHSSSASNAGALPAGQAPAATGTQQQPGAVNGPPQGAFGGGFGGGLPGEQHLVGTLTAVGGSSITVNSQSGTATYPIDSSTLLVKNGQRVASLSELTPGDPVVVHVYPQNGGMHVEMVIDGGSDDNGSGTTTNT